MKIAVVGATGLVGSVMLKVLKERGFANNDIIAAASARSAGRRIAFAGRELTVVTVNDAISMKPDFAIFSAGAAASRQYAPLFAAAGTTVIDNSSAWRKDADKPLVVPEINYDVIKADDRIIANPNCSTIQMVLAVSQLHLRYKIKRLVISTYQSITGTGVRAVHQLQEEEEWHAEQALDFGANISSKVDAMGEHSQAYPYQIFRNLFPHGGDFQEDGYTTEEQKLVDETRKILRDPSIAITATVARVPVMGGHSEAVNVEFHNEFDINEVRDIIANTPGVVLYDDPSKNIYPMPLLSEGRDEVFVGRVRRDLSQPRTLNLWVVADNLRKGAATNAIQIMEKLIENNF
ncbi:MAG: aspartate-semialdehyde dehydrogenase [Bacteroidales bacterium]|nr:aspartate-semialdehyde dehydrogenase [Bacteroidales bacterium]